jgi:hypothetical protein
VMSTPSNLCISNLLGIVLELSRNIFCGTFIVKFLVALYFLLLLLGSILFFLVSNLEPNALFYKEMQKDVQLRCSLI